MQRFQTLPLAALVLFGAGAQANQYATVDEAARRSFPAATRFKEISVQQLFQLLFVRPHVLPPTQGTADTNKKIDELSNRAQVNQYLQDPTKQTKDGLLEKVK